MSTERNTGFMLQNSLLNSRLAWQAGLFRNADKFGNDKKANEGFNITTRLSGLPIKNDEKKQLLHLGVSYSIRKPVTKEYIIKSKPESHLAKDYVNTETISDVDIVSHLGTEVALVIGPLSFQGEFVQSSISTKTDSTSFNYSFKGFYGQISYFITGEHRKYINYEAGFDRVNPKNNFGDGKGGIGALEVALRYSGLNLNDGAIDGGQLNDITLGLNWHLNPATRIMANYLIAQLNDVGNAYIFQMRFQIDF